MIGLLFNLIILCLIFGVIWWIIGLVPLPETRRDRLRPGEMMFTFARA